MIATTPYIAGEIRAEMARQRMMQTTLAELARLSTSQGTLSRRVRGLLPWRPAELVAVAAVLRMDLSELLGVVVRVEVDAFTGDPVIVLATATTETKPPG